MNSICAIALMLAISTPSQRDHCPPLQIPNATISWTTPISSRIQPHVLTSWMISFVSPTKNDELSIAAIPSMTLRTATIMIMTPAKVIQPDACRSAAS
jgi:hypothetical protein